jgi:hypothetical protein
MLANVSVGHPGPEAVEDDAHRASRPGEPRLPMHDRRIEVNEVNKSCSMGLWPHAADARLGS